MSVAPPAFLWLPFAWGFIFHPFSLSLCVSVELSGVSWRQHGTGSWFLTHPGSLCLLIGDVNPFIFRVIMINENLGLPFHLLFSSCSIPPFLSSLVFLSAIFVWVFLGYFSHFLLFCVSCLCSRCMFCGHHEICIKRLIDKIVLFLLTASTFICLDRFHPLPHVFLLPQITPF